MSDIIAPVTYDDPEEATFGEKSNPITVEVWPSNHYNNGGGVKVSMPHQCEAFELADAVLRPKGEVAQLEAIRPDAFYYSYRRATLKEARMALLEHLRTVNEALVYLESLGGEAEGAAKPELPF